MNYTSTLAKYAVNMKFDHLPLEVVEQAKLLTLHVLGVSLAGTKVQQGRDAILIAKELGGNKKEATIWGDGSRVACAQAAFANGTLADVLDWEDCSPTGHPSAGAIPGALVVGENIKASGKDCITAIVAGYELYQRIALSVQPTLDHWMKSGWGLTSWQIFASAIPAAKLLGFNEKKMAQTIGVAGALTPVSSRKITSSRTDLYHYLHGTSCRDGITSALIAKHGINMLDDMLDGETGYWSSISDISKWEWLTKELGEKYFIMDTLIKHWPANMWIQQFLDIMHAIVNESPLTPEEILEIIVSPNLSNKSSRMIFRPAGYLSITDAQFSIPYCIAAFLHNNKPGPHWFVKDQLNNPEVLKLASKVKSTGEDVSPWELFKLFQEGKYLTASIKIITRNGKVIEKSLHYPKGHPQNRLSVDELTNRFRCAASSTLSQEKIEKVIEAVLGLENLNDVSQIIRMMD